jgi:ferredoxin-thioredoxin reductase catalytic subunit
MVRGCQEERRVVVVPLLEAATQLEFYCVFCYCQLFVSRPSCLPPLDQMPLHKGDWYSKSPARDSSA